MRISNNKTFNDHPLDGQQPDILWGTDAVDGDYGIFADAAVGSLYVRRVESGHTQYWTKVAANDSDYDWACEEGIISQQVAYTDFTDGGGATGTLVLTPDIPAGATVTGSKVYVATAFDGASVSTATLTIGDGTDADRYNTGTPSVNSTGWVAMGAVSGTALHSAAIATVTLTVTEDSDFGDITSGVMTVFIRYYI